MDGRWSPEVLVALGAMVAAVLGSLASFVVALRRAFPAGVPDSGPPSYKTDPVAWVRDKRPMIETKTEGMVTKAEHTKGVTDAVNAYKAHLIKNRLLKGADAPPSEGGGSGSSRSEDEQLGDPDTPIATVKAILARRAAGG